MNQQEIEKFFYGYNFENEIKNTPSIRGDDEAFWKFIKDGYELLKKESPEYGSL